MARSSAWCPRSGCVQSCTKLSHMDRFRVPRELLLRGQCGEQLARVRRRLRRSDRALQKIQVVAQLRIRSLRRTSGAQFLPQTRNQKLGPKLGRTPGPVVQQIAPGDADGYGV